MTLLFLILKVIGYVLLAIVGTFILAILIILFLPIDYGMHYKKYENAVIRANVRLFYMIRIHYEQAETCNELSIKLFGRTLKKIDLSEEQLEEEKDDCAHVAKKRAENKELITTPHTEASLESDKKVKRNQEHKHSTKTKGQKEAHPKKSKKANTQESIIQKVKGLWQSHYRKAFFAQFRTLLKKLWLEFKPHTIKFKLIIGKDDPAETGELIAKLTMLYPFIYRYGVIEGDYTEAGFWGEVMGAGRIRIFNLIKAVIIFALNKDVRHFIKIILNVRKVESNGI